MKLLLIGFLVSWGISISGQTLKNSDFVNTEWYSYNSDSTFFKKDTIILVKYSNVWTGDKGHKSYYESFSHADSVVVKFDFGRRGTMRFWEKTYERASISIVNDRTWEINSNKNELVIRRNKKIEFIFIPIKVDQLEFKVDSQVFTTVELTMKKKK